MFWSKSFPTAIAILSISGCTIAPPPPKIVEQRLAPSLDVTTPARIMSLSVVKTNIPLGKDFAAFEYGWFCKFANKVQWRGTELNITRAEYLQSFGNVLLSAKYPQPQPATGAFDKPKIDDFDLLVGATIEDVDANLCVPFSGDPNLRLGFTGILKGGVYMKVRWQLFSPSENKVVYETTTEGSFKSDEAISASVTTFLRNAFESNVKNLIAEPGFIDVARKPLIPLSEDKRI